MTDTPAASQTTSALDNVRVVLVQTFHPGNIGATARAILTMGIKDLVLVNPRCFPDEEATRMASGAAELLENARVVEHLEDAVNDCQLVIGASARLRSVPLPHFDEPREMAAHAMDIARDGKVALVFGRERFGLTNEEIACCTHQVSIPTNPDYGILNVSQAAQVLAHECRSAWRLTLDKPQEAPVARREDDQLPTREQLGYFHEHLGRALQSSGFLNQPHSQTEERLRALFARAEPTRRELSILRGMLSNLERQTAAANAGTASEQSDHEAS
ncbi:RNA methyltransferase [Cobetia sp. UCD-24C]|uniref:RNA methyltransferase n=1 Tax=Cobetia sp. UCD-24C TaxID=1716176 RepID=UPI0006CA5151|nr:RNA methyltransferase [Cobetia sp. UCD-24C]KPM81004.1 RNA methyltransferase [Cobetia sp. UCD-24C]